MIAKNLHLVAFLAINSRHVNHGHVHTNVTHIVGTLPINQTIAMPIAQTPIQSIGITDGNGSDHAVVFYLSLSAITYRIASFYHAHLQNCGF